MAADRVEIRLAIEGTIDQVIMERLITGAGAIPVEPQRHKKSEMRKRIIGFNHSAAARNWIVLIDLDHDTSCAPELCREWLPHPAEHMYFRVAKREIESWILADRERLSRFISVPLSRITTDPEDLPYPKEYLINLARQSTDRNVVRDMVPRPGSGRTEGSAYISWMIDFVHNTRRGWRPEIAASHADSLARCIRCLKRLAEGERLIRQS
ncbi:MAG: hypothetical protein STSR0009_25910 [Methanoregula sp.]